MPTDARLGLEFDLLDLASCALVQGERYLDGPAGEPCARETVAVLTIALRAVLGAMLEEAADDRRA